MTQEELKSIGCSTIEEMIAEDFGEIGTSERAEFELCSGIADKIDSILKTRNMTQRDLARLTGKRESEVSKWLTGRHNFTMKTIALISSSLGQPILNV